jgi:hypothetical protein
MNLFIVNTCPARAAQELDDVRVIKIALEATQILCTALHQKGIPAPYKPTHPHHPVTVWAGEDDRNANWVLRYGYELCKTYESWTGKKHACVAILDDIREHIPDADEPESFQNSARNGVFDFSNLPITEAYQKYLNARYLSGKRPPKWTKREKPWWYCPF